MDNTNEEKRNLHNNKLLTAVIRLLGNEYVINNILCFPVSA